MNEEMVSISELIYVIKSRWRIVAITSLIAAILVSIYSFFLVTPRYSSNMKLYIGKDIEEDKNDYNYSNISLYQDLAKSCTEIIPTESLVIEAINRNNIDADVDEVLNGLEVLNTEKSQIVSLTYRSSNPESAKLILDAVTNEFIRESKELLPNGSVKIIENSKYAIYPDNINNIGIIMIGICIGIIFGITLIFLTEYINNTFKTKEQIKRVISIPVMGVIPLYKSINQD